MKREDLTEGYYIMSNYSHRSEVLDSNIGRKAKIKFTNGNEAKGILGFAEAFEENMNTGSRGYTT